jgi:SAM-dependent methyltransferase
MTIEPKVRAAMEGLRPPDDLILRYEVSADAFFESGSSGVATLRHFGLEPHHQVLDPGCGAGRMAIALTQYLTPDGGYEGFDVFRDCIEWCGATITPRYPNFGFTYADVFVTLHNEAGKVQARDYRFPYDDERFDFVVLISVFTHMLPDGFEQYLSEIARVLKTGGRVWTSFMLLNDATIELIDAAPSPGQPVHDFGHYRLASTELPEDAVAFREEYVRDLFGRLGLEIRKLTPGDWASHDHPGKGIQDGVFAVKVDHPEAGPALQSAPPGA